VPDGSQLKPIIATESSKQLQPEISIQRTIWKRPFLAEVVETVAGHEIHFTDRRTQNKFTSPAKIAKHLNSTCTQDQNNFFINVQENDVFLVIDEKVFFGKSAENISTDSLEPTSRCAIENIEFTYFLIVDQDDSPKSLLRIVAPGESIDQTFILEAANFDDNPKIQTKFKVDTQSTGTAFLYNGNNDEVFTWELSCNFDMSILIGQTEIPSVKVGDWYSWKVLHPEHLIGKIKSKQSISFGYVKGTFHNLTEDARCRLNGMLVSVDFETASNELL
jgi:hypothetical protein